VQNPRPLPRSAVLIVNARSRRGRDLFQHACEKLAAAGIELTAKHALSDPRKLPETVREAVASGAKMVIVGGGDGSLSSAVDHLVAGDTVFAFLPLGTANSFARSVGIPLDLDGAIDVIANGRRKRVDLGMIENDYFANCAAIGLSPLIGETIPHKLKAWLGKVGYLLWAFRCVLQFRPFTVVVDGETLQALEVRIANGSYHGGVEVVDEAEVDSGEIVIQAVVGKARTYLALSWLMSVLRLPARRMTTREFRGRVLRLETDPPLPISIDGEVLTRTPVTVKVAPKVVEIAAPRESQLR
jgi:YegS/Rv2252/BmrU family lipid kinase